MTNSLFDGEGNGIPLQYSCLKNPMDRGAWGATVHGVTRVGHDLTTKPPLHTEWENAEKVDDSVSYSWDKSPAVLGPSFMG